MIRNIKSGVKGIALVICSQSILNPYIDKIFAPSKRVWRLMAQVCSLYLFGLVFVYYQNGTDARQMFKYIDPKLSQPVEQMDHTYDDDCTVSWANLIDNMDYYFLGHFVNWFLAAVILRDAPILHVWSLLDEVLELSF